MTWHKEAACCGRDERLWETPHNAQMTTANEYAVAICNTCPVRLACLSEAMESERGLSLAGRWHIWGRPHSRRAGRHRQDRPARQPEGACCMSPDKTPTKEN